MANDNIHIINNFYYEFDDLIELYKKIVEDAKKIYLIVINTFKRKYFEDNLYKSTYTYFQYLKEIGNNIASRKRGIQIYSIGYIE